MKQWLSKHLVDDWQEAHKWFSVHGAMILTVASTIYAYAGAFQSLIPAGAFGWFTAALGLVIIAGRIAQQGEKTK